jgi:hypothetical protein
MFTLHQELTFQEADMISEHVTSRTTKPGALDISGYRGL